MKLYLAGPMRGIPYFNYPAFKDAASRLRADGHYVFSPAERDVERLGVDISTNNVQGSNGQAESEYGFNLREALNDDLAFICLHADGIALLPGWQNSKGANAELATAQALGLEIIEL